MPSVSNTATATSRFSASRVTGPVDALAPAAAEEALDAIAPGDDLGGVGRRGGHRRFWLRRSLEAGAAAVTEPSLRTIEIAA